MRNTVTSAPTVCQYIFIVNHSLRLPLKIVPTLWGNTGINTRGLDLPKTIASVLNTCPVYSSVYKIDARSINMDEFLIKIIVHNHIFFTLLLLFFNHSIIFMINYITLCYDDCHFIQYFIFCFTFNSIGYVLLNY